MIIMAGSQLSNLTGNIVPDSSSLHLRVVEFDNNNMELEETSCKRANLNFVNVILDF